MTEFNALLRRSFAEAPEPADDGFTVKVGHAVARRETALQARAVLQGLGMAAAGAAALYGVYGFAAGFGQELLATAGLEVARAHGALSSAPSLSGVTQTLMQSLSVGMTQILLTAAALAGGAVAFRAVQE